jgi:hypothetical protein
MIYVPIENIKKEENDERIAPMKQPIKSGAKTKSV